ncbi:hypothetical protein ACYFX5_22915 [Bremerella sp. T1]|nr:hypothetical protein [Bremerella volcania]UBM35886.1 hypothetical protein LA756_24860 [Bremerella volcania]
MARWRESEIAANTSSADWHTEQAMPDLQITLHLSYTIDQEFEEMIS